MTGNQFAAFRDLHHADRPLLLPNAWDYASGATLVRTGFPAVGTTSLGVAAAAGKPDAAGDTRKETLTLARSLSALPVPITVDIENGFSDRPDEVAALVAELAAYGVAGVNIEDGRSDWSLAPIGGQVAVIEAVKAAVPQVFLNARTDTFWLADSSKPSMPETLTRVHAYTDAGGDGVFVPGVADDADIRMLVEAVDLPLNVLYLPGRHAITRLADLGVRRVSCGSLLYRAALHVAVTTAVGIADGAATVDPSLPSYADIQHLVTRR